MNLVLNINQEGENKLAIKTANLCDSQPDTWHKQLQLRSRICIQNESIHVSKMVFQKVLFPDNTLKKTLCNFEHRFAVIAVAQQNYTGCCSPARAQLRITAGMSDGKFCQFTMGEAWRKQKRFKFVLFEIAVVLTT